jgi:hypothetical protein
MFYPFTGTAETSNPLYGTAICQYKENWYAILAQTDLPKDVDPDDVNDIHMHLFSVTKNFLVDKFQTLTQMDFSSPPSYLFQHFIAFILAPVTHLLLVVPFSNFTSSFSNHT